MQGGSVKYLYEFIGTFFLVFTVGMVVIQPSAAPDGFAPIAIGTVLAVMIFLGGHVSGGHYNPAVSLAVFLRGGGTFTASNMLIYWVVQIIAGFVAAFAVIYMKGAVATADAPVVIPLFNVSTVLIPALIAEFLFTFALTFTVVNVATAKATAGNSFYGWAIGMAVLVGAFAVGPITGGAFNPAVAVGITQMGMTSWSNIWIYLVPQLLAAVVAAYVFKAAHTGE
jgi:aquaporin Z